MCTVSILTTALCTFLSAQPAPAVRLPERVQALGQTREYLQKAYARLSSPPLSELEFVLSDVSFRERRRFTEYSGDVSGRMLGALGASAPLLGDNGVFCEALMKAFAGLQKPDGHFGADQDLSAGANATRDMPILWGNSRLLLALAERSRRTGDAQALKMARGIGDYVISTRPYYGRKENFGVGDALAAGFTTCYPAMIDGLTALGEVSGDRKYLDEARFIAKLSLIDTKFEKHHSHGRMTAFRGMLDLDRVTGQPEFLDAVRAGCRTLAEQYEFPTGGIPEVCERTYGRDEGCSDADWIRVNLLLWRATGENAYLDAAEHALDHLLAAQFSNGGFGHRPVRTLQDGAKNFRAGGFEGRGSEAYWCCSMHGTQLLADVAQWSVVSDDSRLLVTWLGEARSTLKIGQWEVTAEVRRERPDRWKITLVSPQPGELTLRLRVPAWASQVTVDGKTCAGRDGWADVQRAVNGSDSFIVEVREGLRICGISSDKPEGDAPVRLFVGPAMLCLPDVSVGDGLATPEDVPTLALPPVASGQRKLEALLALPGDKWQIVPLVPISQRPLGGCRVLFHVRPMKNDEFKKLAERNRSTPPAPVPMEISFAAGGPYEIYLNGKKLASGVGFDESPRLEAYSGHARNVVLVRVHASGKTSGLIGLVFKGSAQPHVTTVDGWSVIPCPAEFKPESLTTNWPAGAAKLKDLGTWGAEPWGHMPAQFALTGARWIWPDGPDADQGKCWVFRCEIP
jgi:hypothetical protein